VLQQAPALQQAPELEACCRAAASSGARELGASAATRVGCSSGAQEPELAQREPATARERKNRSSELEPAQSSELGAPSWLVESSELELGAPERCNRLQLGSTRAGAAASSRWSKLRALAATLQQQASSGEAPELAVLQQQSSPGASGACCVATSKLRRSSRARCVAAASKLRSFRSSGETSELATLQQASSREASKVAALLASSNKTNTKKKKKSKHLT